MIVYRWELPDGRGPYTDNGPPFIYQHNDCEEHPVPPWPYRCAYVAQASGFANKWQARRWFNYAERKQLRQHGYVLRTYYVRPKDIIYRDDKQLIFKRDVAVLRTNKKESV